MDCWLDADGGADKAVGTRSGAAAPARPGDASDRSRRTGHVHLESRSPIAMPPVAFPQAAPWAAVVSRLWVRSSPRPRGSVPPAVTVPMLRKGRATGSRSPDGRTDGKLRKLLKRQGEPGCPAGWAG